MKIWDHYRVSDYLALLPWVWVQFESAETPGPFPFLGGIAPEVTAALHEAHQHLLSGVETAISDVFARRASLDDPNLRTMLEDAYAELVNSRPQLSQHIRCGRRPDGTFQWEFPHDPSKSSTVTSAGLRIFHAVKRQAIPLSLDRMGGPAVARLIGLLDGSQPVSAIRTVVTSSREHERTLTRFMDLLHQHECLAATPQHRVRARWLEMTVDRDLIHLGHAALMYRQREQFFLFDPWLLPWFAEMPVPSLWGQLLPRPSAIFLTHDHDDHVEPRSLVSLPKDVPVIVPSRRNRKVCYYDYHALLRDLGFSHVIELAHGESWTFDGGAVLSVPFYGEDPCDLEMPRNCYLILDRGHSVLVHADSGPTNDGRSALKEGVIQALVRQHGPITIVCASQQQLKELRTYAAHAALAPPGSWLEVGENGFLTNAYLAELAQTAQAKWLVSYATGGADWYPDHLSFTFSRRNPARTKLLTAHWEPPSELAHALAPFGCRYHYAQALDGFRLRPDGSMEAVSLAQTLAPLELYRLDHGDPPFMRPSGRG
ncbi:MAG: MBL fold metallo-hydrolase [Nitrospiraceae bacterium]